MRSYGKVSQAAARAGRIFSGWEQIKKQEESSLRTRIWAQDEVPSPIRSMQRRQNLQSSTKSVPLRRQFTSRRYRPPLPTPKKPPRRPVGKGKTAYKVDVLELLKWTIASDLEHEHVKGERAITYLMLDNYYEKVMVTGIPGLNLELQNGEEQAIYYWFYRKSYGYGYSACPWDK